MDGLVSQRPTRDWRGCRVFVTGATGFVGSHLARRLLGAGADVTVLVRPASHRFRIADIARELHVVEGDCSDIGSVARILDAAKPQIVFHAAAAGVVPSTPSESVLHTNVFGTFAIANGCANAGVERLIHFGSSFEYGEGSALSEESSLCPTTIYGASKAAGTILAQSIGRSTGLKVISIRLFTPYGPWERATRLVPSAIVNGLLRRDMNMTSGEQERDLVYIDDAVEGVLLAAGSDTAVGNVLNLCSGQGTRMRSAVELIYRLLGQPASIHVGAIPYRTGEMFFQSGTNKLARMHLGWQPTVDLEEGLQRTIDWYREHRDLLDQLSEA